MLITSACIQKRILVSILFLTLFLSLIYIHATSNANTAYIFRMNLPKPCPPTAPKPITSDIFTNFSLIITIQVHNRASYLKELICSLSTSPNINQTLLIFSHDYFDDEINELVRNITFCKYKQIFYPYTAGFAAGRNFTTGKVSQVKLHWWWKANEAFRIAAYYKYNGLILFLEEDHFVVEDFMHILNMMQENSHKHCSNCIYSLGDGSRNFKTNNNKFKTSKKMSNVGLAFNATTWSTISACAETFCKYDDYNWDWSLNYIFQDCVKPSAKTLIMYGGRVFHIGKCGMHFNNKDCDATKLVKEIQEDIYKFPELLYPKALEYGGESGTTRILKNFGGFGEREDQELCLDFSRCNLTLST